MTTKTPETISDKELGIDSAGIRRLRLEGFTASAVTMCNELWAVGVRRAAIRIATAANRLSILKRDVLEQAILRARGQADRLDIVRAEHDRLAAELVALETGARGLNVPLSQKISEANTLVRAIEAYTDQCRKDDGGEVAEELVDWRYQDKIRHLSEQIRDCAELQSREYGILRAQLPTPEK